MIINNLNKFIHVAIPRTATTCLNTALGNRNHPEPILHHATISEILEKNPNTKDFFKFTFVRNPFDKLVSIYHEFRKNRGKQYSGLITYEKDLLSEFDMDNDVESFRNFCRNLGESKWVYDLFFKPQFDFISIDGENIMDFIGRFEDLEGDWSQIREDIGFGHVDLQKSVVGEPRGFIRGSIHQPYKQYYSGTEIKVVEKLYSKDLEYFNYKF